MMKNVLIACTACALAATATMHAQRGPDTAGTAKKDWMVDSRIPFESKTIKGLPYSAELVSESIQSLADGNRIVQRTTGRVYRDSEGRVRREEDRSSGTPAISVTDPVARTSFSLSVEQHEVTQTPMPFVVRLNGDRLFLTGVEGHVLMENTEQRTRIVTPAEGARGDGGRGTAAAGPAELVERAREVAKVLRASAPDAAENVVEEKLQDRVMGGIVATGTRRTTTIAARAIGNEQPIKIVSEEWFSPELQILVMTEHTDPRTGRSTYQLSNINRNEPSSSLFQIPSDYTIRRNGIK